MIPLKDENPTTLFPIVTISLIVLNALVFLYELSLGPALKPFLFFYGATPAALWGLQEPVGPLAPWMTIFTAMFLHGGLFHVAGNMLYLWIFGNNVEDAMGHGRFLIFYLLSGLVAAWAHALTNPASMVPMIGASGAVSGVLGAYLVLFPHARVLTLVPLGFFIQIIRVPALLVLGFWIVIQIINGMVSLGATGGGVAWFAHIGGFLVGVVLVKRFVRRDFQAPLPPVY